MNIYENMAKRTDGNIYMGVVGPVRTGKSTFIRRFMDLLVIPNIENVYERRRIMDELPQSGTGKTITTTEPKFIPAEAVKLKLPNDMDVGIRLVDCVGYLIPEAVGHQEEGRERMVQTPWDKEKIPFEDAAHIGTEKVIKEHSTVGVVITTDGTIGTMTRDNYIEAEERTISEMKVLNKPFVVVLNSVKPNESTVIELAKKLAQKYNAPVMPVDCLKAGEGELTDILIAILERFPVREITFKIPGYVEGLENHHWLKQELLDNIKYWSDSFEAMGDIQECASELADGDTVVESKIQNMDMGTGHVSIALELKQELYYKIITELMDEEVADDYHFFNLLKEFSGAKKEYDKLKNALMQVEGGGYGIVAPKLKEMMLEEPEVFKQGNKYGVKITARAPTLHIIKTDITTEVSPIVGSEKQSEELVRSLKDEMKNSPKGIWETNIFGKSLYEMVAEQMENKISGVPENVRAKMQKSLQKISDEGKEYFICIVI